MSDTVTYDLPTLRDIHYLCSNLGYPRILFIRPRDFNELIHKLNPTTRRIDDDGEYFYMLGTKIRPSSGVEIHNVDLAGTKLEVRE